MKIYFAGVPGDNQLDRERDLLSKYRWDRLISFYYLEQGLITLKEAKDANSNKDI